MSDLTIIDQITMERILYVLEESLKVSGRTQFYGWSQGALHGLLPHELLLCACGDLKSFRFKCHAFASVGEDRKILDKLADPMDGLLAGIIDCWIRGQCNPITYSDGGNAALDDPLTARLRTLGGGHAMAHGTREWSGSDVSFFIFMRMPGPPGARQSYLLEMVIPHLHMALGRMMRSESQARAPEPAPRKVLSERELTVLRWVEQGKTNYEIGLLLNISPLTVKNHVQKILRKLGVSNRAQAVSKGIAAHLLGAQSAAGISGAPRRKKQVSAPVLDESE